MKTSKESEEKREIAKVVYNWLILLDAKQTPQGFDAGKEKVIS